jgi:hypothetical protein
MDRLEEVHRAASLVRLEMAQEMPSSAASATGIGDAGEWGDREASDLVLGLLDAVLPEEIVAGPKGLVDPLGRHSLADRDEGDVRRIDAAALGRMGDPIEDRGERLRDRSGMVSGRMEGLVDQLLLISCW